MCVVVSHLTFFGTHYFVSGYWQTGCQLLVLRSGNCVTSLNWNTRSRLCKQSPPLYLLKLLFCRCMTKNLCFFLALVSMNISNVVNGFVLPFQKDYAELTNQNNELKFRIHAMEQQAQLRDGIQSS